MSDEKIGLDFNHEMPDYKLTAGLLAEILFKHLQELENKYREENDDLNYNNGFADGVQQSMNEITKILDKAKKLD